MMIMNRNQRDFANRKALKRAVGLKYLNNSYATDFMYDFSSKTYSASITHVVSFNLPFLL